MFGKGTIHVSFGVAPDEADDAQAALEAAGFRVRRDRETETEIVLEAADFYATDSPDAELQREHIARAESVLSQLGVSYRSAGHGIVIEGGTEAHRWVDVIHAATGRHIARVLAIDEAEAAEKRNQVAKELGIDADALEVRWDE